MVVKVASISSEVNCDEKSQVHVSVYTELKATAGFD